MRSLAVFLGLMLSAGAFAREPVDLLDLSLEQLTNVVVTTVSRRPERLLEAPASIFVISAEDIRRSGATTLPEALRLAPNLQVARADTSQYAISARGLNTTIANNMLVLIDGRTVYTPLFSGVFWDAQDVLLSDVERIEVISGPAALLWGSNGVNGVINVITRPASETQGPLAPGGAGNREAGLALRQGGKLGETGHYRLYAKYFDRREHRREDGASNKDDADRGQVGFRADFRHAAATYSLQGDAYGADIGNPAGQRRISGANLLGRRVAPTPGGGSLRIQAYLDHSFRDHVGTFRETLDVLDLDFQHALAPSRHNFVWGGGYRTARDRVDNTEAVAFIPARRTLQWWNLFAHDEIALGPTVQLTLGARGETNSYTGFEFLPNVRLTWHPSPESLWWAQYSRTVRAPSRLDRDLFTPGRPPFLVGNTSLESEIANVAEVGYRAQVLGTGYASITAFAHERDRLRSLEPAGNVTMLANGIEGHTRGVEGWIHLRPAPRLSWTAGFLWLDQKLRVKPGHIDVGGLAALGNDPRYQIVTRASWLPRDTLELDLFARRVGPLPSPAVPGYTAVDARVGWKVARGLDLTISVQNLFDRAHVEWGPSPARAVYPRAFFVGVRWQG